MTTRWRKGLIVMPKGKMTLDKLARMVQTSLASINGQLNGRIDGLNQSLTRRIDSLEERVDQRFDSVETEIATIRRQLHVAVYQNEFDALERRVGALERKQATRAKK